MSVRVNRAGMTERAIFTITSQLSVTSLPTGTGDKRYQPVTSNENGQRTSAPRLRVTPHRTCTARPRRDQFFQMLQPIARVRKEAK